MWVQEQHSGLLLGGCSVRNTAGTLVILTEVLPGFSQPLGPNFGFLPRVMSLRLPSKFFPIRYSVVLPFYAVQCGYRQ
jgi:hypothetical protein